MHFYLSLRVLQNTDFANKYEFIFLSPPFLIKCCPLIFSTSHVVTIFLFQYIGTCLSCFVLFLTNMWYFLISQAFGLFLLLCCCELGLSWIELCWCHFSQEFVCGGSVSRIKCLQSKGFCVGNSDEFCQFTLHEGFTAHSPSDDGRGGVLTAGCPWQRNVLGSFWASAHLIGGIGSSKHVP